MENNDLNRLHKTLVEILDEIVRVCEEHDIKYFLCGGTLLGAVRHQGFIPWDDDLDIIMPREDYDKFCELCSTELGDKYYLHSAGTDKKYWNTFAKVRKKNTVYISEVSPVKSDEYGIFVDIFPQDRTVSQNSRWQRIKNKTIKYLSAVVYCKSSKSKPVGTGLSLFYYLLYFTSVNRIIRFSTRIMVSQNNNPKATYGLVYPAPREIEKEIMPMTVFEPYSRISFEGKEYNAPNDPDYYLTSLYGDYLKLPPVEQRISHTPIRLEFE